MLISYVVPVYNASKKVERPLVSVFDAALPEGWSVEVPVVDDGSSDRAPSLLQWWAPTLMHVYWCMKLIAARVPGEIQVLMRRAVTS